MRKIKILLFSVFVLAQFFNVSSLAQTKKTAQQDTTKKSVKNKSNIELPDVLIYGEDRSVRQAGNKLRPFESELKIVASPFEYLPSHLSEENQKHSYQSESEKSTSRKMLQLNYGKFQQLETTAGLWQETDKINFGLHGGYSQSDGQFENSQFAKGQINGQIGGHLTEDLALKTKGGFQYFDYGLYGAETYRLKRKNKGSGINVTGFWSQMNKFSAEFGLNVQNTNFEDRDSSNVNSDFSDSEFSVSAKFETKYKSINISAKANYYYNNFENKTSEISKSQNLLTIHPEATFFLKKHFVFRTGLLIQNIEIIDYASETSFSPDIKIIFTPSQNLGFELKASSGYQTLSYLDSWKNNPFITSQFDILPLKKRIEIQLGGEYRPASNMNFKSVLTRTDWENYAFWSRDSLTGLFQFNNLKNIVLFSWDLMSEFDLSPDLKFSAGFRLTFDSVQKDSMFVDNPNVPYIENVSIPIDLTYKIYKTAFATINFGWVGPRKISLTEKTELPGYGLLSFRLQKQLYKNYFVFISGQNLLDQKYERWENYPGRGIYFEIGLRGSW